MSMRTIPTPDPENIFDATLLRRLSIALNDPIDDPALSDTADNPYAPAVDARHFFRVVRGVLQHIFGNDSAFPGDDPTDYESTQDLKVAQLYQSPVTRSLIARTWARSESDITPFWIHQTLHRVAWLNDAHLTSEKAQSQLDAYLYGFKDFWDKDIELGHGDYSELGDLFASVPEDLQPWMVQFKRGLRLAPAPEWFALAPASALYQGLLYGEKKEATSDTLTVFASVVSRLLPTHDDYHDEALMHSLTEQLDSPGAWISIVDYLLAIPTKATLGLQLQIDAATPLSTATRCDFFRRIAVHVLNPDNKPWLDQAIAQARRALGMRILSLATSLCVEQPKLTSELALRIASLLLMSLATSDLQSAAPHPPSRAISAKVPGLDQWCTTREVEPLFQQLGLQLLSRQQDGKNVLRLSPADTWQALMQTASFKSLFAPMLAQMKWYGGEDDEQSSPLITQALAGRAIVDYFLAPTDAADQSIEALYFSSAVGEYSHNALLDQLRQRIKARQPSASPSVLSLLEYLLLREMAPELLVKDVPDSLWFGRSLQSVVFLHGVALLEALSPGATTKSGFDDLVGISAKMTQSNNPEIHALWAKTQALPALRYAIAHNAIAWLVDQDLRNATVDQITQAVQYLNAQQGLHAQELNHLLALKPPDRQSIAQQQLTEIGVPESHWNVVPHGPAERRYLDGLGLSVAASYGWDATAATPGILDDVGTPIQAPAHRATLVELVMMGEFYVRGKSTVPEAYQQAFETFRENLSSAEGAVIRRLLTEMPASDKALLATSTCDVSRLKFATEEGAHGIFIRCQSGDQRNDFHSHAEDETYFEVIPAAGVARRIVQRFNYNPELDHGFSGNLAETVEKNQRNAETTANALVTPQLPVDSSAYLKGTVSRSASQFEHPLQATLVPSLNLIFVPNASETALDSLADEAAGHLRVHAIETLKQAHLHETDWEKIWAVEKAVVEGIARLLVPFYGCIKDLSAGEKSAGVLIGCAMDIAFTLIPMGQFVGATARVIWRAGEFTVLSIAEQMTAAIGRLTLGLAEQSALFMIRDLPRLAIGLSRLAWAKLLEQVPALKKLFAEESALTHLASLKGGTYRLPSNLEQDSQTLNARATVDGVTDVAVLNVGTSDAAQFRLLDPYTKDAFGPALTTLASSESLELSTLSATDSLAPGHYPAVLPVTEAQDGIYALCVTEECEVNVIRRDTGLVDIVVDGQPYRFDTAADEPVLRKLAVTPLSTEAGRLEEIAVLCRPVRDLVPGMPCADYVKLELPAIGITPDDAGAPPTLGQSASAAFSAREFQLARDTIHGDAPKSFDLLVHEGKACKWDHVMEPAKGKRPARLSADKKLVALTSEELDELVLSATPEYRETVSGRLSTHGRGGIPDSTPDTDVDLINARLPLMELESIALGVADRRVVRSLRMDIDGTRHIVVEADTGVFYKAPQAEAGNYTFSRMLGRDEINRYLILSEGYRLAAERPYILRDRENIARLLFNLEKDTPEFQQTLLGQQVSTYEEYVLWCLAQRKENELYGYAERLLTGESMQQKYVQLAKESIADFKQLSDRTIIGQQHNLDVLNRLLPLQGKVAEWGELALETLRLPETAKQISRHIRGTNFAYAMVETADSERFVYYAFSGGKKARNLKFRIQIADQPTQVIDGVTYVDAGMRMKGRAPDPDFTSLPVLRDADHLSISEASRELDSERLVASILKEDQFGKQLLDIHFVTLMDTCRSCGGVILPQIRLTFPDVNFSVSYLMEYNKV
jgi:hypothetical protein